MKEILEAIKEDIAEIKVDIAEMKVDVRHHIKRSDQHEDLLMTLSRFKERSIGAMGFITMLSTLITIYMIFK